MDRRILFAVGVVVLGVVLFLVLRPEDAEDTSAETPTPEKTTESTTNETETQTETETAPETGPKRVVVVFRDGRVVDGIKRASVQQGESVVFVVRSDVADEVHLHGYDLSVDVAPGEPAQIRFTADLVGRFDVELEGRHLPLAELEVEP